MTLQNNRVAVTGIGAICGLGHDLDSIWEQIVDGKSGISTIENVDIEKYPVKIAGEVKSKFTDSNSDSNNLYSLSLSYKIPLIAAMQGHDIGGGFALGLFADFMILIRESVYTTNFMTILDFSF